MPVDAPQIGQSFRDTANPYEEGDTSELTVHTKPSELTAERGVSVVATGAAEIEQRWEEKRQREGTRRWYSPFDRDRSTRRYFDTPDECAAYMVDAQPMQIEQAMLESTDFQRWSPICEILDPPRTLEDMVPAADVERIRRQQESHREIIALQKQLKIGGKAELNVNTLLSMTEQMAVMKLSMVAEGSLPLLGQRASAMGKTILARRVRELLISKGVQPTW